MTHQNVLLGNCIKAKSPPRKSVEIMDTSRQIQTALPASTTSISSRSVLTGGLAGRTLRGSAAGLWQRWRFVFAGILPAVFRLKPYIQNYETDADAFVAGQRITSCSDGPFFPGIGRASA